jgi:class 3 adenylate cyclase/predicted ATPase
VEVGAWLRGLGLERYEKAFRDNDIDTEVLPELTGDDLLGLGIASIGHRRKLLAAIAALRAGLTSSAPTSPPAEANPGAPPAARSREAERRQLTVMFVDLVGSTELSRRLDPEDMRGVIHAYQNTAAGEILRFGGHVAKFMGDGILAYFGWPRAHEEAAERAVRAGLAVVQALGGVATPAGESLAARVGIATGLVVVGDLVGEGAAQEEAVVGDTPNLAARLQQAAEPGTVAIAEATRRLVGGLFNVDPLPGTVLRGFGNAARAFRVLGESAAESRFEAMHGAAPGLIVGRDEELALLLERWRLARAGEGQVVLLSGEPGIGKSRIVLALRERLRTEDRIRVSYACSPYHENSVLWPVVQQLERAARFSRDDGPAERLAKLRALLAEAVEPTEEMVALLAELLGLSGGGGLPSPALTPQQRKARTLDALITRLEGMARRRPVLLILEDTHWLDPTTRELFDLAVGQIRRLRVLLLVTFRPELAPPWVGFPHVTLLTLNRLARAQAEALVTRVAGGRPLPPEVVDVILARTEGVPLFTEELTKAVLEAGLLRETAEGLALAGPLPPLAIPATLSDSLMARLDRLGPIKHVAQSAACIGREFSHELLAAVAGLDARGLQDALEQLARAELVFRHGTPPEATYSFKHALVRDTAYESLLRSRRQQLHGRIADALERQGGDVVAVEPETLAHHLTEAGFAERAVEYWLKAGQRAAGRSAHKEAISHLTRGLGLLAALPATEEHARQELELQVALGTALHATKGWAAPEVELAYARIRQLGLVVGERRHLAVALRGLCYVHNVRARLRHVEGLTAELLDLVGQEGVGPVMRADAHNANGFNLFHLGRFHDARDDLEAAATQLEQSGGLAQATSLGVSVGVFNRAYAAHCDWHLGHVERALDEARQSIELARHLAHPFSLAVALAYGAMLAQFRREPNQVRELAEAALVLTREHGFSYYRGWAEILAGWASAEGGDVADGALRVQRGLAGIHATGAELRRPYYLGLLAELHLRAGHLSAAADALGDAFAVAERNEESWNDVNLWLLKGDSGLALAMDTREAARACYERAVGIAEAQGAASLVLRSRLRLARLRLERADRDEAREQLAQTVARFDREVTTPELEEARAATAELAG